MQNQDIYESLKKRLVRASAIVDKEGTVLHCTKAAKEMFNTTGAQLQNGNINQILGDDLNWKNLINETEGPVVLKLDEDQVTLLHIEQLAEKADRYYVAHFESPSQAKNLDVVFENVSDVISINTLQGIYVDASASVKRVKGYEPEELIGQNYYDYVHEDDKAVLRAEIDRHVKDKDSKFSLRYRFKHQNGAYIWLESIGEIFYTSEPEETLIYTLSRDISKQVEVEKQNEEIKSRFLEIFESIDEGIVYQDENGAITNANKAAQKILGLSLDQMQGRTSMHPEWKAIQEDGSDYPGETHPAMRALQTGEIIRNQIMGIYHPEQKTHVWIKVNSYPLFDSNTKALSGVHSTFIDITSEYNYAKAIEESESKFRVLFDNAFQFIGLMEPDGTMIDANETGLKFLGVSKEDAIGAKLWETPENTLTESVSKQLERGVAEAATGKFVRFDFEIKGQEGQTAVLDFSLRPIFNEANEVTLLIPEGRDITQRIELQKALASEKELNELQSHFVMSASHQFRTPLTIIQSNSELLQHLSADLDKDLQQKLKTYTDRISKQVEHTISLMDDIMLLGKIASGVLKPSLEPLMISSILNEISSDYKNSARGERMVFRFSGEEKKVNLDRKLLKESINNLISNALKYSEDEVVITLNAKSDSCVISVLDKGLGIAKDDQKNIFQPFFRSQQVNDFRGTGLGLPIAKEYIEIQGGTIDFMSSASSGTRFYITFKYLM